VAAHPHPAFLEVPPSPGRKTDRSIDQRFDTALSVIAKTRAHKSGLLDKSLYVKAPGKWTRDLQTSDIEFNVYLKNLKGICKENELRQFYSKFLHRIIVTKKELCLHGIQCNSACVYCQESDSISH